MIYARCDNVSRSSFRSFPISRVPIITLIILTWIFHDPLGRITRRRSSFYRHLVKTLRKVFVVVGLTSLSRMSDFQDLWMLVSERCVRHFMSDPSRPDWRPLQVKQFECRRDRRLCLCLFCLATFPENLKSTSFCQETWSFSLRLHLNFCSLFVFF